MATAAAIAEDKKKYKQLENVLTNINKEFISLSEDEVKRNNKILKEILHLLTQTMKQKDNLFKEMYTTVFYGGSYYDGLRVGKPDEFDLDLLFTLPKISGPALTTSNIPGYVHIHLKNLEALKKQADLAKRYKDLDKQLLDEKNYLNNQKVRQWMERVVSLTLNSFNKDGDKFILPIEEGTFFIKLPKKKRYFHRPNSAPKRVYTSSDRRTKAKMHKAGPAFTLKVYGENLYLDIDLVPCFEFNKEHWPNEGFRSNPVPNKPNFFIVPKPIKGVNIPGVTPRYWRLSFQEQESKLMEDNNQYLKPTIKLLKKMRDVADHKKIASYYIKTVALWETEKRTKEFWSSSLSYVFITILKQYYECLNSGKILYYWNRKNNLLQGITEITMKNMANRIKIILEDIEKYVQDNPKRIAKYLLSPEELARFEKM